MANTPVNGVGWYLDDKGTLISPWVGSSGGTNANNPYSNVSGYWGTYLAPGSGGDTTGEYINSITQQPVGTVGRFALGQRPDAYMGLARSPIIEQQLANIDTQSKIGYGGGLGRWQFGSTGNAPATAPVGWGRNPGSAGGAPAAPWQPITSTTGMSTLQSKNDTNREVRFNPVAGGGLLGAGPVDPAQASAGYGGLVPNNSASKGLLSQFMQTAKTPVAGNSQVSWVPTNNVSAQTKNVGKVDWSKLSDADLAYAYSLGQQDPGRYKSFWTDAINWGNANPASELMRVDYANPVAAMNFNSYNGPLAALAAQYNGSKVKAKG